MPGRPKVEVLRLRQQIFDLHAQRKSHTEISKQLGIAYQTVSNHINAAYKEALAPVVEQEAKRDLALIEQTLEAAVKRYLSTNDPADAVPVRGFLQDRAKLLGLNAPDKINATVTQITQEDLEIIDLIQAEKAKNAGIEAELKEIISDVSQLP